MREIEDLTFIVLGGRVDNQLERALKIQACCVGERRGEMMEGKTSERGSRRGSERVREEQRRERRWMVTVERKDGRRSKSRRGNGSGMRAVPLVGVLVSLFVSSLASRSPSLSSRNSTLL